MDRESVLVGRVVPGRPVDPPDEPRPFAPRGHRKDRPPVIPPALASRAAVAASLTWAAKEARYHAGFHAVRAPKYAVKTAGVRGARRAAHRRRGWSGGPAAEEGNWHLRQAAADSGDAAHVAGAGCPPPAAGPLALAGPDQRRRGAGRGPGRADVRAGPGAVAAAGPGRADGRRGAGRAARRTSRSPTGCRQGKAYRKLTAELVRRALLSVQLSGINSAVAKDPNAITFPVEIHRDGPGHLAVVDLPYGVEAADVIARRGRLASGLRLPLDQVWPEPAPGHTGRLALWVGHEPASQMRQPAWPLLRSGTVDVFKPFPFATTPRLDTVMAELMFRNWLFGGQPGSGKSFALRLLVLAAALDVRVGAARLRAEGRRGLRPGRAGLRRVRQRQRRRHPDRAAPTCSAGCTAKARSGPSGSSTTPSSARPRRTRSPPSWPPCPGPGCTRWWCSWTRSRSCSPFGKTGKEAGETAEKCIKLFRALGIILLLGTQIPDKDSLPTGITRNINTRFCLSVADQVANDMILGTSAYKLGYRATVFEPGTEAGWGILAGMGKPGARRSFYIDNDQAATVMARAIEARAAAGVLPEPAGHPGPPGRGRAGRRGRDLARRGRRRLERDPAGTAHAAAARRSTAGGSPRS